jgi:hypothetical protein
MEERGPLFKDGSNKPLTIFSIGHSNQSIEAFLALLQQHQMPFLKFLRDGVFFQK